MNRRLNQDEFVHLRNLLEISTVLTNYESTEQTIPAVLDMFPRALPVQTAIVKIGPSETYVWKAPGAGDGMVADALERTAASYRLLFDGTPYQDEPVSGEDGGPVSITLPIATRKERVLGLVQVTGEEFSEADLIHLNAAVNQIALALKKDTVAQEKAAEAERGKRLQESLMLVVSHELKNPLTAILSNAEFLLETHKLGDGARKNLEAIQNSAERMNRLTNDLLDWANIGMGKLSVVMSTFRLEDLVNEALAQIAPVTEQKNIRLDAGVYNGDALMWCDGDRILQIFSNLLGNAVKFSPKGGRISLRAISNTDETVFSVSDSGPGIPLESQGLVFDRFWQLDENARLGSGLGLSIAKGLVEAHNGRIWLASEPGMGTTFFFTLPRQESSHPHSHPEPP